MSSCNVCNKQHPHSLPMFQHHFSLINSNSFVDFNIYIQWTCVNEYYCTSMDLYSSTNYYARKGSCRKVCGQYTIRANLICFGLLLGGQGWGTIQPLPHSCLFRRRRSSLLPTWKQAKNTFFRYLKKTNVTLKICVCLCQSFWLRIHRHHFC